MKEKTFKEQETEKRHGRKRFIERVVEDKEAAAEIEEFLDQTEEDREYEDRTTLRPFS